jgi:hypothetical protein
MSQKVDVTKEGVREYIEPIREDIHHIREKLDQLIASKN